MGGGDDVVEGDAGGEARGEAGPLHGIGDRERQPFAGEADGLGDAGFGDHADGDGVAVQQREVQHALHRMGDGVAEVEDLPETALAGVFGHDFGLDADTAGNEGGDRRGEVRGRGAVVADGIGEPEDGVEVGRVGDDAVLDHLGKPAAQHVLGERVEHLGVDHHGRRIMEGADEVLAEGGVDGGLAAHRGIDHRQQGGGHLHDGESAHEGGGHEAGEVTDHTAADGDDRGIASSTPLQQGVGEFGPGGPRFHLLSGGHGEQAGAVGRELGDDRVGVQGGDGRVADDRHAM